MEPRDRQFDSATSLLRGVLEQKRRRLGTTLQQLAAELVRERRRSAELQRELEALRSRIQFESQHDDAPGPAT